MCCLSSADVQGVLLEGTFLAMEKHLDLSRFSKVWQSLPFLAVAKAEIWILFCSGLLSLSEVASGIVIWTVCVHDHFLVGMAVLLTIRTL